MKARDIPISASHRSPASGQNQSPHMNSSAPQPLQALLPSVDMQLLHSTQPTAMGLIRLPLIPLTAPIGLISTCSKKGVFQLMLQIYLLFHYFLKVRV